jgi:NADPH:quinone reductase
MRAIMMNAAGASDVLQLRNIPIPPLPSSEHIRVKLAAAGINPVDTKLRSKPAYFPDNIPAILGCDGAGVVEAVGSDVTRFAVGDEVYFCNGGLGDDPGNYAEYTTLHEEYAAAKPASFSMAESAALPLVLITVWEALLERARLQPGQTILIHAGAGGVGHIAIQIARHLGARVAVTVSDEHKATLCKELGAEKIINYRAQDFVQETLAWSNGNGADVVFDTVGGDTFLRSMHATGIGGKLVTLLSTPISMADSQLARMRNLSLCYEMMLTPQVMKLHERRISQRRILEQGADLADEGKLKVLLSKTMPLAEAAAAHRLIEHGGVSGKIVLTMG